MNPAFAIFVLSIGYVQFLNDSNLWSRSLYTGNRSLMFFVSCGAFLRSMDGFLLVVWLFDTVAPIIQVAALSWAGVIDKLYETQCEIRWVLYVCLWHFNAKSLYFEHSVHCSSSFDPFSLFVYDKSDRLAIAMVCFWLLCIFKSSKEKFKYNINIILPSYLTKMLAFNIFTPCTHYIYHVK